MTPEERRNLAAALRFVEAYDLGTADWVEECHAPDTVWSEMPSVDHPLGRGGGFDELLASAQRSAERFHDRHVRLLDSVAQNDRVALQVDWRANDGKTLVRACVATFLTFRDGRIVQQHDYVCPLGSNPNE